MNAERLTLNAERQKSEMSIKWHSMQAFDVRSSTFDATTGSPHA
jgi:hypothetical protein